MTANAGARRTLIAALAAASLASVPGVTACRRSSATPLDIAVSRETRLLVVAPHPDDEAIAAAGLIARVRARGGRVHVVLTTSGDGFAEGVQERDRFRQPTPADYRSYGRARERETIAAMHSLGVPAADITFLGFPDEGLCLIASRYLSTRSQPFESPFTDRATPPGGEQIIRGVRYRGMDLERELTRVVDEYGPNLVVMPDPEDEHPDHCSTYIFANEAVETAMAQRRPQVLRYLVHYGQWPVEVPYDLTADLHAPIGFPTADGSWLSVALTSQEAAAKKTALTAYTTQMEVIGRFLLAFARPNELFLENGPLPPECWCDAENVATSVPASKLRGRRRHGR